MVGNYLFVAYTLVGVTGFDDDDVNSILIKETYICTCIGSLKQKQNNDVLQNEV